MAEGDYPVGRGRPPLHSRFKPGQSGNPKGRKRRRSGEAEIIAKVRDEPIEIILNGRKQRVTVFEAAFRRMMQHTLSKGSVRELLMMMQLCARYGALPEDDRAAESKAAAEAVMQKIVDIFDKTEPDDDPDDPGPA